MPEPLPITSEVVYEVWCVVKVPGEFKRYGWFKNHGEAWLWRETLKYVVDSSKVIVHDRRA